MSEIQQDDLVRHKAYSIARGVIIEELDLLWVNWLTPENALRCYENINKYALMLKDTIVDWEDNLYKAIRCPSSERDTTCLQ